MKRIRAFVVIAAVLLPCLIAAAKDAKLTAAEVIEKHIASIGTKQAIQANVVRDMTGKATARPLVGGTGLVEGPSLLMAEAPNRFRLSMQFDSTSYPVDEYVFNGQKIMISTIRPGYHSRLGEFLYQREVILKDGLLGGTLSSAWPLLDLGSRKAKLNYDGIKKIDGRELHQITYVPKTNPDQLNIKLYFEPETFRHVLSTYSWVTRAEFTAVAADNPGMREHHYRLDESFSDFRTMNGITLPVKYSLKYSDDYDPRLATSNPSMGSSTAVANSQANSAMWLYELTFDQFNRAAIPAATSGTTPAQ